MEAVRYQPGPTPEADVRFLKGQDLAVGEFLECVAGAAKELQINKRALAVFSVCVAGLAVLMHRV